MCEDSPIESESFLLIISTEQIVTYIKIFLLVIAIRQLAEWRSIFRKQIAASLTLLAMTKIIL